MNHYLSIILRNQFNLFYRFGYTYIPIAYLIEFDGSIMSNSMKDKVLELFNKLTPYEWEEEYLVIHLTKMELDNSNVVLFNIEDISSIYPLSAQAKASIESKSDTRIRFEEPIFEKQLITVERKLLENEIHRAINALWSICEIEGTPSSYESILNFKEIFSGLEFRRQGKKCNSIKNGSYMEYLIVYDRYDYFPNSILGYYYDAGQVFAFSKGHHTFEGSGLHSFLEMLNISNPNIKTNEIIKQLESSSSVQNYTNQTTIDGLKYYIIAPLFFMFRDEIRKTDDFIQTNFFIHLKDLKKLGEEYKLVAILLGAFFGFRKFYDAYYEHLNLRFYKTHHKEPKAHLKKEKKKSNSLVINDNLQSESNVHSIDKTNVYIPGDKVIITISKPTQNPEKKISADNEHSDANTENVVNPKENVIYICQKYIKEALRDKPTATLTEIAGIIKKETRVQVKNQIIENVINTTPEIEIVPRSSPKVVRFVNVITESQPQNNALSESIAPETSLSDATSSVITQAVTPALETTQPTKIPPNVAPDLFTEQK